MLNELKPCKVCDREPRFVEELLIPKVVGYYLICKCNKIYMTKEEAIQAWNKRHEQD